MNMTLQIRVVSLVLLCALTRVHAGSFAEVAQQVGLDFVHFNGMSGDLFFHEMMGAGVALVDVDNDGDLDVYLPQGHLLGQGKTLSNALIQPKGALGDRLYINRLEQGGGLAFDNASDRLTPNQDGYAMGVASGDVDGDGFVDLYLTRHGANRLLLNDGNGGFEDVTEAWNADDPRWSVAATFFDYDRDGRLDLFVGNYVRYESANNRTCRNVQDKPDYCSPQTFPAQGDRLLRNTGRGFVDVTRASAIAVSFGPALGAVAADFDSDGWPDLYVANDGESNLLWINQGNGRFTEGALMAGVAVNMDGVAEASMGVSAEDFDGDGDLDLFMTHLDRQTNTLYVNNGRGWFNDRTGAGALGAGSFAFTGFGTAWLDYDNDGLLDLISANGGVTLIPEQMKAGEVHPMRQRNQLWRNTGSGYEEVSAAPGSALALSEVSRGLATGDVDNDGDLDVLITNNAGPVRLLRNDEGSDSHWIGLTLYNEHGHANPIGAQVAVTHSGGTRQVRRVHSDGSYVSASDPRILVGLGKSAGPVDLIVTWPAGGKERWRGLAVNQYHRIKAGEGHKIKDEENDEA